MSIGRNSIRQQTFPSAVLPGFSPMTLKSVSRNLSRAPDDSGSGASCVRNISTVSWEGDGYRGVKAKWDAIYAEKRSSSRSAELSSIKLVGQCLISCSNRSLWKSWTYAWFEMYRLAEEKRGFFLNSKDSGFASFGVLLSVTLSKMSHLWSWADSWFLANGEAADNAIIIGVSGTSMSCKKRAWFKFWVSKQTKMLPHPKACSSPSSVILSPSPPSCSSFWMSWNL